MTWKMLVSPALGGTKNYVTIKYEAGNIATSWWCPTLAVRIVINDTYTRARQLCVLRCCTDANRHAGSTLVVCVVTGMEKAHKGIAVFKCQVLLCEWVMHGCKQGQEFVFTFASSAKAALPHAGKLCHCIQL